MNSELDHFNSNWYGFLLSQEDTVAISHLGNDSTTVEVARQAGNEFKAARSAVLPLDEGQVAETNAYDMACRRIQHYNLCDRTDDAGDTVCIMMAVITLNHSHICFDFFRDIWVTQIHCQFVQGQFSCIFSTYRLCLALVNYWSVYCYYPNGYHFTPVPAHFMSCTLL